LRKIGREPNEIAGWALTHLHGDHIGGFPFLVIDGMFHQPRSEPLAVVGPVGSESRLDGIMRVAYGGLADDERPYSMPVTEIAPGASAELAGVKVIGFAADHQDLPEQPLCLRVETPDGQVVAFSGDTAMCDGLFEAADGADLWIAECSGMAPPWGRHCTWQEWQPAFARVTAKRLVLTHLGTEVRERVPELLTEVPSGLDLAFADDGMVIEL
jgi:ribonuclease BN (tRNA processing enzyme)